MEIVDKKFSNSSKQAMKTTVEKSTTVRPFEITVSDDLIIDLQRRLNSTRWITPVKRGTWDYGVNFDYLQEFVTYWKDIFNWHEQVQKLNRFKHYKAKIENYDFHFIHQKGKRPNAIPLLLL